MSCKLHFWLCEMIDLCLYSTIFDHTRLYVLLRGCYIVISWQTLAVCQHRIFYSKIMNNSFAKYLSTFIPPKRNSKEAIFFTEHSRIELLDFLEMVTFSFLVPILCSFVFVSSCWCYFFLSYLSLLFYSIHGYLRIILEKKFKKKIRKCKPKIWGKIQAHPS